MPSDLAKPASSRQIEHYFVVSPRGKGAILAPRLDVRNVVFWVNTIVCQGVLRSNGAADFNNACVR